MSMKTFAGVLRARTQEEPDACAFAFLDGDGGETCVTYAQLDERARTVAARLQHAGAAGEPVLILLQPGFDYVVAVFGCIYAGCAMVPVAVPRRIDRADQLRAIAANSEARFAIGSPLFASNPAFPNVRWISPDTTNTAGTGDVACWRMPAIEPASLALLQYTSGSTGSPRGVAVSHANLMANARGIEGGFRHPKSEWSVTWLPPFHDMGLMGGILQPVYLGVPSAVISPIDFARRPAIWLEAVSRFRAHTSGGPNFAYEFCARNVKERESEGLRLDNWKLAFTGAEPVRADTLDRFAKRFAANGFTREAFFPCYGLAEATLYVSGGRPSERCLSAAALRANAVVERSAAENPDARIVVASGRPAAELNVRIVNPETRVPCAPGEIGEIWLSGPTVAGGYRNCSEESEKTFRAQVADESGALFLRTGDLGFLADGELFVTGRSRDLIIVRGRNHYPQDIEDTVAGLSQAIRPGSCAAFSIEAESEEKLVFILEMPRPRPEKPSTLAGDIRQAVAESHELQVASIVIVAPGAIPRTSSGKVRRLACRERFLAGALEGLSF